MHSARPASLIALVLFLPACALAWHSPGHMAVARIAWEQLDDGQKAQAFKILQKHPHKDVFLAAGRPQNVEEPVWFFVKAATWPDWVRNPQGEGLTAAMKTEIRKKYNKPGRHFVNLPFVHPDETDKFDASMIRNQILIPEFDDQGEPRHALAALKQALQKVQSANSTEEDKAVSLCWVLHLIGDLHQPLHASALIGSKVKFDPQEFLPPEGDKGGNRCAIKVSATNQIALELHSFWDALQLGDQIDFTAIEQKTLTWLQDPNLKRNQFPELSQTEFLTWADESLELAKKTAYREGDTQLKFIPLPPSHTAADLQNLDAPSLSDNYKKTAGAVAQKRIVLAGYRVADQLKPILTTQP